MMQQRFMKGYVYSDSKCVFLSQATQLIIDIAELFLGETMMRDKRFHQVIIAGIISIAAAQVQAGAMCCDNYDASSIDPWNGFYLTGQIGTAKVNQDWNFTNHNFFNTLGPVLLGTRFNLDGRSFVGGAALGYNYQSGHHWVPGMLISLSGTSIKPTVTSPFFSGDSYSSEVSVLAALKAQLGYAYDDWLFNFNGGLAMTDSSIRFTDAIDGVSASSSKQWNAGWILGLGVDRKISESFSCGLGYDYADIKVNSKNTTCASCGSGVGGGAPSASGTLTIQTVMVRASYLFNQ